MHVGGTREQMAARFVEAWRRAERGEAVEERHLSYDAFGTLAGAITSERLDLLRHLHRMPEASVTALAAAVGRTEQRVREDVLALAEAELIERTVDGVVLSASSAALVVIPLLD